ncbi:exonuclease [Escherichia coli]|nr:exonuclease [Escherichia coli]
MEAEPSVEREGPFYFVFTDKDGEKYGRANKLSGLDKALAAGGTEISKKNILPEKWHIYGLTAKYRYRRRFRTTRAGKSYR